MILIRHELQKLVEIHFGYRHKVHFNKVSDSTANWTERSTAAALEGRKRRNTAVLPVKLRLPPDYIKKNKREQRRSLGILLICNGISGVEVKALLGVDQSTVSRWSKGYRASFTTAKRLIGGVMSAKGFSDESIQAELGIEALKMGEYRESNEWVFAAEAWRAENVKRVNEALHSQTTPERLSGT